MESTDVSIDATVVSAKQKQTKWCLVPKNTKDVVLIKVLRQEKVYDD